MSITDDQLKSIKEGDKLETPDGVCEVLQVIDMDAIRLKRADGKFAILDKSECSVIAKEEKKSK